jgi:hypothetical protein
MGELAGPLHHGWLRHPESGRPPREVWKTRTKRRGGRKIGTPNRRTAEGAERLAELGCEPIEGMARLSIDQTKSPELRGRMFSELAEFVAPKRKAVEHTGADGGPIETGERAVELDYSRLTVEELRALHELVVKATPGPAEAGPT